MNTAKTTRDAVMEIILEHHHQSDSSTLVTAKYLEHRLQDPDVDVDEVVEVLRSMGFLTYERWADKQIHQIKPSDSGIHYFETSADEREKTMRVFKHEWKIAVFSGFAGALLSRPLWDLLDVTFAFIASLFS